MAVPSSLSDLSTTAASNSPAGSESIGTSLDDYLRSIQAIIKQGVSKGSDIASASTITPVATSSYFIVTGTTGITSLGETYSWTGRVVVLKFDNTLTLTHSSGLILPGAANITTAAGHVASFVNESAGVWRCVQYNNGLAQPYDADTAKLDVDQTWTGSQRGAATTDNDGSFDQNASNNFICTPTGNVTLTFTNHTSGQSGFVLFDNSGAYTGHAVASSTKVDSSFLSTINATGVYLISYFDNGTNAYCVTSKVLA